LALESAREFSEVASVRRAEKHKTAVAVRAVAPAGFEYVARFVLSPGAVAVLDSTEYRTPPPSSSAVSGAEAYD